METAVIVKIAVSAAPYSIDKPYDYLVPEELLDTAVPGVRVLVPFGRGNRLSEGVILARGSGEKVPKLKAINRILDAKPVLSDKEIALALWMRQRYFCTLFDAIRTILPAGLWYGFREIWSLAEGVDVEAVRIEAEEIPLGLSVLECLSASGGSADYEVLQETCGADVLKALKALQTNGIVTCETTAKRKIQDKTRRMAELAVSAEEALALVEPKRRSAPARYAVVELLAATGRTSCADISYYTGASMATLKGLEKAGVLRFFTGGNSAFDHL